MITQESGNWVPASTEITPITYQHSQRIISTKIVALLAAFDRNYGEGTQLKHDWGVFAAAWRQELHMGKSDFTWTVVTL